MKKSEHRKGEGFLGRWVPRDEKGKIIWWVCVVLAVGFGWYLIGAENEWSERIRDKLAAGKKLKPHDFGVIGLWRGALVGLAVTFGILATSRWWGKGRSERWRAERAGGIFPEGGTRVMGWILALGILGAVVLGGFLRVPRLDHSLWNDEEYSVRRYTWGQWEKGADGKPVFDGNDWEEALFLNRVNNHLAHTVEARVGLKMWQMATGNGEGVFSEAAVRFIPLLMGLGTIALVGVLGCACGLRLSGLAGAYLLALSPWHLRYSVEARGYSSMLFYLLAAMLFLYVAVRSGKWRWWFLYGAGQSMILLSFLGAIYAVVALNVSVIVFLWLGRGMEGESKGLRWMVPRWLVAGALTSLPFVLLEMPSVPQVQDYFSRTDLKSIPMDYGWLRVLWSHLAGGIPWVDQSASVVGSPLYEGEAGLGHLGIDVLGEAGERPWTLVVMKVVIPLLALAGTVALLAKNGFTRMLVVVLGFSAVVLFIHNLVRESWTLPWYLIQLVPLFALALPAGVEWTFRGKFRRLVPGLLGVMVVGYGILVWPAVLLIAEHDRQPIRQTVEFIREAASPHLPLTGAFGTSDRQVTTYDYDVRFLEKVGDVDALIAEGQKLGRPVYVYFCGDATSWMDSPEVADRVGNDPRFRTVGRILGLESMFSYRVLQYEP